MEHDRWKSGFTWGLLLGLLIGTAGAGAFGMMKLAEAQREVAEIEHIAYQKATEMGEAFTEAEQQRDRARKKLEALKKAQKDR